MTADLIAFLRARLDEDEQAARKHACALDCMNRIHEDWHRIQHARSRGDTVERLAAMGLGLENVGAWRPEEARHTIHPSLMHGTALDPARVLADIDAKRAVLAAYEKTDTDAREINAIDWADETRGKTERAGCQQAAHALRTVVEHLAAVYDSHPDYDQSWRPIP